MRSLGSFSGGDGGFEDDISEFKYFTKDGGARLEKETRTIA